MILDYTQLYGLLYFAKRNEIKIKMQFDRNLENDIIHTKN